MKGPRERWLLAEAGAHPVDPRPCGHGAACSALPSLGPCSSPGTLPRRQPSRWERTRTPHPGRAVPARTVYRSRWKASRYLPFSEAWHSPLPFSPLCGRRYFCKHSRGGCGFTERCGSRAHGRYFGVWQVHRLDHSRPPFREEEAGGALPVQPAPLPEGFLAAGWVWA